MIFAGTSDSLHVEIENSSGTEKIRLLHKAIRQSFYTNTNKAEELSLEAVKLSEKEKIDSLIAYSHYYLGLAYYFKDYWKLSAEQYQIAFNNPWTETNPTLKSAIANNIAIDYELLIEYDIAAEYYYKGLKIKENTNDSLFMAKSYMNLGLLFIQTGEYEKAKEYFLQSLHVFRNLDEKRHTTSNYQNLGIVEYSLGNNESGERYFNIAIQLAEEVNDSTQISKIYLDFGNSKLDEGIYKIALDKFRKSLAYQNPDIRQASYYFIKEKIGETYLFMNNLREAELYLIEAVNELTDENQSWLSKTNLSLARLYAKNGDWEKFNFHLNKYNSIQDEILKKEEFRSLSEMQVAYETDKKNAQLEIQKLEITAQNVKLVLVSGIAVFLILGSALLLYSRIKIKERNKILLVKNRELSDRWNRIQQFYLKKNENHDFTTDDTLFAKITKLINEEKLFAKTDLVVEDFARKLNTNIKYVSAAIKEQTDMNFNTFINTYRIEEAKQLLKADESKYWSIDAIAENCGFNNPTSFYQAFKKNTGMTPTAFKNTNVEVA